MKELNYMMLGRLQSDCECLKYLWANDEQEQINGNMTNGTNYMMLSRLQSDCEYYLNAGGRCLKYLWANDEQEQINEMKKQYNLIPTDKKPEWLTYKQIEEYEKLMVKKDN